MRILALALVVSAIAGCGSSAKVADPRGYTCPQYRADMRQAHALRRFPLRLEGVVQWMVAAANRPDLAPGRGSVVAAQLIGSACAGARNPRYHPVADALALLT